MMIKPLLSIIILNYNTAKVTIGAILSIETSYPEEISSGTYQVIVADNASPDDSLKRLRKFKKKSRIKNFEIVANTKNIGFSAGNNNGYKKALGDFILFLNPDTVMKPRVIPELISFIRMRSNVGIVTCRLNISTGEMDQSCHRGFPTPWNAFCHFSGLEEIFPKIRFFSGYSQSWKNINISHEIDACSGAFILIKKNIFERAGKWDEDYFFYGEDLDLCFNVKKYGYKIYFIPAFSITHYGGISSGIKKHTQNISTSNNEIKAQAQRWRFEAMRIFYKKNYVDKYPKFLTWIVFKGIDLLEWKSGKIYENRD